VERIWRVQITPLFSFAQGCDIIVLTNRGLDGGRNIMKSKGIVLIMSLMLLLTSCTVEPDIQDTTVAPDRNYVDVEVTYSEPTAQYAFKINMDSTETEAAKYFFESSIDGEEREACIEVTESVLSKQVLENVAPEIYIFSQDRYDHKRISDHKLYSSLQEWKSVEYITDVLLVAYGERAHYGTALGYANYLAKSYHWDSIDSRFSEPSVSDIFDLNYLCFDEDFASSHDVAAAKGIACDFVNLYIGQHGEQEFRQLLSCHSEAMEELAAYYTENGVSYAPSTISYGYGGKKYDYLAYSDYGTFYIGKDWVDMNAEYNPLITDGFLHSNYAETKAFFETNLKQMKQYQDLFNLDNYNNDLDIVFSNPISASKYSFYQTVIHRIYLYSVDSLMHEYIHSLTTTNTSMAMWKDEGFARYFSYYYDSYGMAFLNQDYNNAPDTPELKYVHEYLDTINRPIDMAKDYSELENIAVYSRSITDPNANYLAGSSFVQYLVKQYGEKAVIHSIYGNGDPLPKTYAELVKEWNEFIETNYATYSKYE